MINNSQLSQKCILIKKYFNFLVIFIYCLPKLFSDAAFLPCPPDFVSFLKDPSWTIFVSQVFLDARLSTQENSAYHSYTLEENSFSLPQPTLANSLPVWDGGVYPGPLRLVKLTCLGLWCVPTNSLLFGTVVCTQLPGIWSSLPVWDGGVYPPIAYLFVTVVCTQLPGIWSSLSLHRFYTWRSTCCEYIGSDVLQCPGDNSHHL